MFENLKGMTGMAGLMKDLPKLKQRLEEVRQQLETMTVEASTGGGAVTAVANGKMRIVKLKVDPALISGLVDSDNPDDQAMAEDLITGAVNAALEKAQEMAAEQLRQAAMEMDIPLPPGALNALTGGSS